MVRACACSAVGSFEAAGQACVHMRLTAARAPSARCPCVLRPHAEKRGLKCRWQCGRRSALLKILVPALRVPLRLVAAAEGEEDSGVEVPADLQQQLAPTSHTWPRDGCVCRARSC